MFGIFNKGMLKHKLIINYLNRELSKLYLKYEDYYGFHAYSVGYEYSDWEPGIYLGRYTTFSSLNGYMDFINKSDYETIKAYFKCKKQVEEYMKSYVVFRRKDGVSWFERRYKS